MSMKIFIEHSPQHDGYNIWALRKVDGRKYRVKPMQFIFEEIDPLSSEYVPTPTLQVSGEVAQEFFSAFAEALNRSGFKPEQGYLEGKLGATEKHLEDMRKLALKKDKE